MHGSWFGWLLDALALGIGAAGAFVAGTCLLAFALTRGKFGWPGLRYFATETLWVCLTQTLLPFGWFLGETLAARSDGSMPLSDRGVRPIILIHGYTQNRANFVFLARALRRRGLGPFFGFNYRSFRPIEESARALREFVERVIQDTGAAEVDLVCHSLGGLVARTYVDLLDGHRRVRRVVTLGTPHRGHPHANLALGASVRDMHPRAGFIARLEQALPPRRASFHSIYSLHDNIVFPSTSASLGDRGTDIVVQRHGHFAILFSSEVAEHVVRALADPDDQPLPLMTAGTPTANAPDGTSDTTTALAPMIT